MFEWINKATNEILLDDNVGGKGKTFRTRFLQSGLVKYSFGVCLLEKSAIDRFVYEFEGCPVIINHKDVTSKSAKDDRVGVISKVWFDQYDGWYWGEGVIFDQEALNLIDKGYNVSCQYEITEYSENRDNKLHNGNEYDKTILNGRPEHLAIVENPRYENAMIAVNAIEAKEIELEASNGGKGSGNFGHAGRKGKVGGSSSDNFYQLCDKYASDDVEFDLDELTSDINTVRKHHINTLENISTFLGLDEDEVREELDNQLREKYLEEDAEFDIDKAKEDVYLARSMGYDTDDEIAEFLGLDIDEVSGLVDTEEKVDYRGVSYLDSISRKSKVPLDFYPALGQKGVFEAVINNKGRQYYKDIIDKSFKGGLIESSKWEYRDDVSVFVVKFKGYTSSNSIDKDSIKQAMNEIRSEIMKAINEDKWITIHPNGEENKGRPLLLKDGETPKEAIDRVYKKEKTKEQSKKEVEKEAIKKSETEERKAKEENKEQAKREVKKESLTEKEINDRLKEQSWAVDAVVNRELEKLGLVSSSVSKKIYGDIFWGDQVYERTFHREYSSFSDEELESRINKAIKNTKKETGVSIKVDKIGDRKYRFEAVSKGDVKKFLSNAKKKVNEKENKDANSFHNTLKDIKKKGFNYLARDKYGYVHAFEKRPRYVHTVDDDDDYEPGYWSSDGKTYGKTSEAQISETETNAYLKLYDKYNSGGSSAIWTIDELLNAKKKKAKNAIMQAINEIKETNMFKGLFKKKENEMEKDELKSLFMECLQELTASNEQEKEVDYKKLYNELKEKVEAENKCKNEEEEKKAENEEKEEEIVDDKEKEEVAENKKAKNAILSGAVSSKPVYVTEKRARELGRELF